MGNDGGFFLAPRLNKSKNRFNGAGGFHGFHGFGFLVGIKCGKDGQRRTDDGGQTAEDGRQRMEDE